MKSVIDKYEAAYQEHGKDKNSLFIPKGRQKERFELLTSCVNKSRFSVLDFGCGFGDLRNFLLDKFKEENFSYIGVDAVESFIKENKKVAKNDFKLISDVRDIKGTFDYIFISGAFNMSYFGKDLKLHDQKVKTIIEFMFNNLLSNDGVIAIDFMHDDVDYVQDEAYHVNVTDMYTWFCENISKRLVINRSVFPYEVTFAAFKDVEVDRESNLYGK